MRVLLTFVDTKEGSGYGKPKYHSIGLMYLAAKILEAKHECKIIDLRNNHQIDLMKEIEEYKPDVVGFHCTILNVLEAKNWNKKIKEKHPDIKTIAGGPQVSMNPDEFNEFNHAIIGEGEEIIVDIIEGKITEQTIKAKSIENLDSLPIPAWHLVGEQFDILPVMATRGCPYSCIFCFTPGTKIITNKGIKNIEDVGSDYVLTHKSNWKKNKLLKREYDGKISMIFPKKINIPINCTDHHPILVYRKNKRKIIKAKNLKLDDHLIIPLPKENKIRSVDIFDLIKKYSVETIRRSKVDFEKFEEEIRKNPGISSRKLAKKLNIGHSRSHILMKRKKENLQLQKPQCSKFIVDKNEIIFKCKQTEKYKRYLSIDKDFCRLAGYYLAEGCVSRSHNRKNSYCLSFTFCKNEIEYISDVIFLVRKYFNYEPTALYRDNICRISISKTFYALTFRELFGSKAPNKKIPHWMMSLKKDYLKEILKGFGRGDGGKVRKTFVYSTVSDSLAYQMTLCLLKLGISPNLTLRKQADSEINGRIIKSKHLTYSIQVSLAKDIIANYDLFGFTIPPKSTSTSRNCPFCGNEEYDKWGTRFQSSKYKTKRVQLYKCKNCGRHFRMPEDRINGMQDSKFIFKKNEILVPIRKIEKKNYRGDVFNLNVSEDHSYTANLFSVKNCNMRAIFSQRHRSRSAKNVVDEIQFLKEKYKIKNFEIIDDCFTLHPEFVKEVCKDIIDRKLELSWDCVQGARIDRLDFEAMKLMKDSGCRIIAIGIESGRQEIVDNIKKGLNLEVAKKNIGLAKKAGLKVKAFFLVGSPGETYDHVKDSIKWFKEAKVNIPRFGMLAPYPHTPLAQWVYDNANVLEKDIHKFSHGLEHSQICVPFDTPEFTKEERLKAYKLATRESEIWTIRMRFGIIAGLIARIDFARNLAKKIYFNSTFLKRTVWE